eukprot:g7907.t1
MEGADATPSFCLKSVVADYQPRTPPRLYKQDTTILKLSDHSVLNFGVTQSWSPHHHSSPAGRWQTPVVEVATTEKISELGAYGGIPQCGESSGQSTEEYYPSDFESETDGETERRQRDLLTAQRSLLKEKCAEVEKDEAEYVITKEGQEKTDGEWVVC